MKSGRKDLLLIVAALVVVLGCGFGVGKISTPTAIEVDPSPPSVAVTNFEEVTLSNLSAALNLTPEQEAAILSDIQSTGERIVESRKEALFEYHLHILGLHDKISGKLEPEQREKLQKTRDSLQEVIEKRFPVLLDKDRASSGDRPQSSEERP